MCLQSIFFALFVANNVYKTFRRAKLFLVLYSSILNHTTPTFQEVGGVAQSHILLSKT